MIGFIKWWWNRNDEFTRTLVCFGLLWVIPCAIAAIWFGPNAGLAILVGALVVVLGWGLYGIFYMLRGMWNQYVDENPPEDIAVMRKLKGIPTPSKQPDAGAYYD